MARHCKKGFRSELFSVFRFPFNLPSPIFNAIGGVLLVEFLFSVFFMIDSAAPGAFSPIRPFQYIIQALVMIIVIVIGYLGIFKRELEKGRKAIKHRGRKKI